MTDYVQALKDRVQRMVDMDGLKDFRISPNEETWSALTPQERAKAILDLLDMQAAGKGRKIEGECMECRVFITEGETHLCKTLRPDLPHIAELRTKLRDHEDGPVLPEAGEEAAKRPAGCDCADPSQCWEPCGQLGNDERFVKRHDAL